MTEDELTRRQGAQKLTATHREALLFLNCVETDAPEVVYHYTEKKNVPEILRDRTIKCFHAPMTYFFPKKEYMSVYLNVTKSTERQKQYYVNGEEIIIDPVSIDDISLLELIPVRKETHRWYLQHNFFPDGLGSMRKETADRWSRLQIVHRGDFHFRSCRILDASGLYRWKKLSLNIFCADAGIISKSLRVADSIEDYIAKTGMREPF